MAVRKAGTAINLPPTPKAGATAKQINANTKAVRNAIARKNKIAREKEAAKLALKRNQEARREFSRSKARVAKARKK